ncbi:hypothetical protein UFOVP736_80 [uncultured Caudovirales phage]|uniref:Uncharacterized protein n=1 Tax=uncultured Caudovirales phage TaxID=2100421 RepID=A0A6J5NHW8_9CAUD|nr:hypothetical protein UFOVP705_1 [uncultured Caudovirales phage]CAB5224442.1 hypothetical protein UFOVP736_80 [uncultured Caudovirales phage]
MKTSITSKVEKSRAKLAKNVDRLAWREKNGHFVTFTDKGDDMKKPLPPQLQFVQNVAFYCAKRIAKSINRSCAKSMQSALYGKTENALASERFMQKKRATDETRKKSSGNFFMFSPCDMEEIFSITAMILTEEKHFDESSSYIYKYAVDRSVLDVIINEIKSIDGLELNRFKGGKHLSLEQILMKEKSDGFCNPALEMSEKEKIDSVTLALASVEISPVAKNNEDFDSLQEKIDAINLMIDIFHDTSDSRKKESLRKSDKEFFKMLLSKNATGNGKTSREAFLMTAKRFLERIVQGHALLVEKTNGGKEFDSFAHLSALFNSVI